MNYQRKPPFEISMRNRGSLLDDYSSVTSVTSDLTGLEPKEDNKHQTVTMASFQWGIANSIESVESDIWDDVTDKSCHDDFSRSSKLVQDEPRLKNSNSFVSAEEVKKDLAISFVSNPDEKESRVLTNDEPIDTNDDRSNKGSVVPEEENLKLIAYLDTVGEVAEPRTPTKKLRFSIVPKSSRSCSTKTLSTFWTNSQTTGTVDTEELKRRRMKFPKLYNKENNAAIKTKKGEFRSLFSRLTSKNDGSRTSQLEVKEGNKNCFLLDDAQKIDDQGFEVVPENSRSKGWRIFSGSKYSVSIFEVASIKKKYRRFLLSRKVENQRFHSSGRKQEKLSC